MNKFEQVYEKTLISKREAITILKKLCKEFQKVLAEYEEKYCSKCEYNGDCTSRESECGVVIETYDKLAEIAHKIAGDRVCIDWEGELIRIEIEGVKPNRNEKKNLEAFSLTLIAKAIVSSDSFERIAKEGDYQNKPKVSYDFEALTIADFRYIHELDLRAREILFEDCFVGVFA